MTILGIYYAGYEYITYVYLLAFFCAFLLTYKIVKRRGQLKKITTRAYLHEMIHNYSLSKDTFKTFLLFVGVVFLLAAFLRPQWDKSEQTVTQEGRDVIIAVDISRSMLAQDVKGNRLNFAKEKIKKLLYNLSCERVGLVVFSGSTIVQCPLTTDYASFFMFLDQLDIDTISTGTTALDQAIKTSLYVFESIPSRKTKLLIAFTDGDDFSTDLQGVKDRVVKDRLSIFTVGIGTVHGAPVPILDKDNKQVGWEKDNLGRVIMSCLNENLLKSISYESGGKYVHADESGDDDIRFLMESIDKFEKDAFEDKSFQALQEQYPYFIAISFLCFALEWIL